MKSGLLITAIALGAVLTAPASTTLNFSVDMSVQIGLGTFVPGTDTVSARGTFNGWNTLALVQQGSSTIYTNSAVDTTTPNPGVLAYKFYNSHNGQWDDGSLNGSSKNRQYVLPATSGGTVTFPTVFFGDASGVYQTNSMTFRVNMAQAINIGTFNPGTQVVYARGTFNSWGLSFPLTNDPSILVTNGLLVTSNVYVGTYDVGLPTNSCAQFKYAIDPGGTWENDSTYYSTNKAAGGDNNRFFQVGEVLPLVNWSDVPVQSVGTNTITFQVDMSAQIAAGRFDPNDFNNAVQVRGSFNSWSSDPVNDMTNLPAPNTNIYAKTVTIVDSLNTPLAYKFCYVTIGPVDHYETSEPKLTTADDGAPNYNRKRTLQNGANVLPAVLWSDRQVNDYLPADTLVTFKLSLTNGTVCNDGHVFNSAVDKVYINGEFANYNGRDSWYPWSNPTNVTPVPQYEMLPVGADVYSNSITLVKGARPNISYKYGIGTNGAAGPLDNEAAGGLDHKRVVRSTAAGVYTMPTDTFGNQRVEPYFNPQAKADGQLQVGPTSGGTVPVKWLGRPGARLQSGPSLAGPWTEYANTDGTNWNAGTPSLDGLLSTTNWPATGSNLYFRLVRP